MASRVMNKSSFGKMVKGKYIIVIVDSNDSTLVHLFN